MEVILSSDIARLVLGYLASQEQIEDKEKASLIFCKKNRYLREEYETYKQGWARVDTTVGLVNLLQDFYSCQSLLDAFLNSCSDKELSKQNVADNTLKGKLERVLNLTKKLSRSHDSQPNGFERKRKLTDSSSSSMITSTPENKQPPNKRQRRVDHTPFVVLSTNSGKRNQSSEKKVLGNEKRKELFTSDSSNDESNIETEPPIIEVKNDTTVVNEEDYEDEDITSPEPNTTLKFNQTPSQVLSETLLTRAKFPDKLAESINIMLQSKEDPNQPSTSAGNTVDNNLTRHIDDLIENIIGLTANEYEYDEILEQAFNTAQKSAESSEVLVDQELTVEVLENSPAIPIVVPAAIAVEQKDPKAYTLRDRKTTINYNEKKKKKIKILSNEPYEGELPSCAKKFSKKKDVKSSPDLRGSISNVAHEVIEIVDNEPEVQMEVQQPQQLLTMMAPMVIVGDQMFNFPIQNYFQNNMESVSLLHYTSNMDPNLSNMPILPQLSNPHNLVAVEMPTLIPLCSSAEKLARNNPEMLATSSDVASTVQVVPQQPESSNQINQPKTPKLPRNLNYLNSKSKSTPRRKGSHIRILDFNTPSKFHSKLHNHGKLSTIKEFSTPQGFIMGTAKTPSSAPPSMKSGGIILKKIERKKKEKNDEREADDSSSNSNSISNTPKNSKSRRKCRIITQVTENEIPVKKVDPLTEWNALRKLSSSTNWEEHLRIQNRNADELNPKSAFPRKRKPVRKSNEPELVESPDIESKMEARLIEEAIKSAKKEDKEEINNENIETNDVNGAIGGEEIDAAQTVPPSVKKHQIKIKIDSPRKNKAKQRNLQKSKDKITRLGNASKDAENISLKKVEEIGSKVETTPEVQIEPSTSSQALPSNRSDSVKEAATTLSQLSTTILLKPTVPSMASLLETPLKDDLPLVPDTPRFLAPVGAHETPMLKFISNSNTVISVLKLCDINTPNEPLTPGFSETPLKSAEPSPNGGYSSRRTDYSSCSSYYKPDESEDINAKLESMLFTERRTRKDSEVDPQLAKKVCVSAKKVECPGFVDKMKDELNLLPGENQSVHYTMVEPQSSPIKESSRRSRSKSSSSSRSSSRSRSSSSSSSSSSCSSCSSSSSSSAQSSNKRPDIEIPVENVVKSFINNIYLSEDAGSDTDYKHCLEEQEVSELVSNEGEVRFPIRNWITPKKSDYSTTTEDQSEQIKDLLQRSQEEQTTMTLCEERVKQVAELEEKKKRVMIALKKSPAAKVRRPAKAKPVPISPPRPISKKESILQRNAEVKQRTKPTPQLLSGRSSSKRKNPTPRKAVYMQAMPVTSSKRTLRKSPLLPKSAKYLRIKSPSRTQTEDVLNTSSTSITLNPEENIAPSEPEAESVIEVKDLKDSFKDNLIKQGFNPTDASLLQKEFIEDNPDGQSAEDESPNKQSVRTETEDEDDELQMVSFTESSSNYFKVVSETTVQRTKDVVLSKVKLNSINFNIDGRKIVLSDSGLIDIFELKPVERLSAKVLKSKKSVKSPVKRSSSRNSNKPPSPVKAKEVPTSPSPKQFKIKVHHKIRPEVINYEKEKEKRAKQLKEDSDKKVLLAKDQKSENGSKAMNKDDKKIKEAPKQILTTTSDSASKPKDIADIDINAVLAQLHGFPSA